MTIEPTWSTVAVTERDGIVELRFHTDGGPLVWTATAHRELTEAFGWVVGLPEVKVVIATGTGDRWCTEIDTTEFAAQPWDHVWWEGRRMLKNVADIEVPLIGVINGPATVHCEIPVMGDIVLAADTARFADHAHFRYRDTVPGDGIKLVWDPLLGPTRTNHWLLTGAVMTAADGERIGFVNEILPPADVLARAWEIADDLARRPTPVLRYLKSVLSVGRRRDFGEGLSHGLALQGGAYSARGGMTADHVASSGTPTD